VSRFVSPSCRAQGVRLLALWALAAAAPTWGQGDVEAPLRALPPAVRGELIERVAVQATEQTPTSAVRVRFHLSAEGREPYTVETDWVGKEASAAVSGAFVLFWVELLDASGSRIGALGTEAEPVRQGRLPLPLLPEAPPAPTVSRRRSHWLAWGLTALATGSLVAGGLFAARSQRAADRVTGAPTDDTGRIVGLTQVDAQTLLSGAHGDRTAAGVLFGIAAASGVGAGVLFWSWELP
jgi:hypothetical protein